MHAPRSNILLTVASFLSLLRVESAMAQKNITVPDTDKSITYSGQGTGDYPACKYTPDGNLAGGPPGCYNVPSMCTPSGGMGQQPDSAAEFTFKGSAIYVTGLLINFSPIYTVTFDGQSTDVDGVRPSRAFDCSPLFSSTNLDPNVDHTIKLSIKEPSPNRNMTMDPQGRYMVFGLVNFIYTVPEGSSASNTTSTTSSANNSTGSSIPPPSLTSSPTGTSAGPSNTNIAAAATTSTSAAGGLTTSRSGGFMLVLSAFFSVLAASR